jgi:glycosyltransferase involved in cell wall biosynthesis
VNSNNNPLLSVLLPVHQACNFLEEALENFINQTFSDFELIILDNLSAENFTVIIKKFQEKDPRIIILVAHQPEIVNFYDKIYNL